MFKSILTALLVAVGLFSVPSSRAADGSTAVKRAMTPVAPGVIYVQFKPGSPAIPGTGQKSASIQSATDTRYEGVIKRLGVTLMEPFDAHCDSISKALGIDRVYRIYYSNHAIDPHRAIHELLSTSEVQAASCQYLFPISLQPNDARVSQQYALARLSMFNAWDITTGDSNVIVGDVDCATNIDHEDLVGEVKYNTGEVGVDGKGKDKRTNGIDDDGDGYVDNWQGWDVVGTAPAGSPFRPDNDPRPDNSSMNHGTLTAGCILATGNNAKGVAGVAWGCRLLPIKASSNALYISGGYEGIHYAVNHGAKVVNCSWGGPIATESVELANLFLREATTRNVLVVAASGNEGKNVDASPDYPANGPGVLCVGATTSTDGPAGFGNYGHSVSVFAPGAGILSTDYPGNTSYTSEDGTSFSSPLTAGVAALVYSMHPTWSPQFVARQVIQTCDNVVNPTDNYYFWGRVNAEMALSTSAWPGFAVVKWDLDNQSSDSLGLPGSQQQLHVTLKNVIATGANIQARLVTSPGYISLSGPQSLGAVAENGGTEATFTISRTDQYTFGLLPVKIYLSDGVHLKDTLTLSIPMKRIGGFKMIERPQYGSSIKRVDNTTAWAAFGTEAVPTTGAVLSRYAAEYQKIWDTTYVLDNGLVAPYCVEATDADHAWFGTGSTAGEADVISTDDAASSFAVTSVTTVTPFVNSIHFFDASNGIFIGDPKASRWGIGVTTNGGSTWSKLSKQITAPTSEASWNNATAWVGQNGWFGSNKNHIWKSSDAGQSWKSVVTPQPNSLSVDFAADAIHGFACCRPAAIQGSGTVTGVNALLYSTDGGNSWKEMSRPDTMAPGSVRFIPDTNVAIFTSNSGVYRTDDYGATWSRVPIPLEFDAEGAALDISRDADSVVISVLSSSNGIAQYAMPFAAPTRSVEAGDKSSVSLSLGISPNPSTTVSAVTFTHSQSGHIKLAVYDVVGREVATLMNAERSAGSETVQLNTGALAAGTYYCLLETSTGERISRTVTVTH